MNVVNVTICIIIICIIVLLIWGKHHKNNNRQDVKLTGGLLTTREIDFLKRNFIPEMLIAGYSKLYQNTLNSPEIALNGDSYKIYIYDENVLKFKLQYNYPNVLVDFLLDIDSVQHGNYNGQDCLVMSVMDSFTNKRQPVIVANTGFPDSKIVKIDQYEIIIYHKIENGELTIRGVRFKLE